LWKTFGPFRTIVDLGCGIGEFIGYFNRHYNVMAVGIEGCENCLSYMAESSNIYLHDLRAPIDWGAPLFDVCMCLEVAEHIEPEYANQLVDNCCSFSNLIIFTAAPPGQDGLAHVNCQPPAYWYEKFNERKYEAQSDLVLEFRKRIEPWRHKKGIKAYYDNLMVFKKWT
jgi:hypothetical protein